MGAESAKSFLDTYGIAYVLAVRRKTPGEFAVDEIEFTLKRPVDLYSLGGILKEMGYSLEIDRAGVIPNDEADGPWISKLMKRKKMGVIPHKDEDDGQDPEEIVPYLTGSAKIYEKTPSFFGRGKRRIASVSGVSGNVFSVVSDRTEGDYTYLLKKYGVQVLKWKDGDPVFDFLIDSMSGN